jgi:hypothetical protein
MFDQACRCGGVSESQAKLLYAAVYWFCPPWTVRVDEETVKMKSPKGKPYDRIVRVPRKVPRPPPELDPAVAEKLKRFVEGENPSLERLREVDPKTL